MTLLATVLMLLSLAQAPPSPGAPSPDAAPPARQAYGQTTVVEMVDRVGRDMDRVREDVDTINSLIGLSPDRVGKTELYRPLRDRAERLDEAIGRLPAPSGGRLEVFHGYVPVFVIAFITTLIATPIMRRLALANGIIDRPTEARKAHRIPVAYLGGVAVFLGVAGGILYSYLATAFPALMTYHGTRFLDDGVVHAVPISVLLGMTTILLVGLLDDVVGIRPHVKIGGQLVAAAALAGSDVGVKVAAGVLAPVGRMLFDNPELVFQLGLPFEVPVLGSTVRIDLVYWTGTAVIALFVLGACNASNLIDGLDGLLSGTTAIANGALLVIALTLAVQDDGPLDAARIVLCLAVMGACLGFLPHNFNPATIFLGDCGSLLLGFCTIVIILMLGDRGQTHLVLAGLIIYAIPIIDTVLAIIRRRMAGKSISDPDDQHLHHMLKRGLGVKGAVLSLYALGIGFGALGVGIVSFGRARVVYALTLVFAAFIVVVAIKAARRRILEDEALRHATSVARTPGARGVQAAGKADAGTPATPELIEAGPGEA